MLPSRAWTDLDHTTCAEPSLICGDASEGPGSDHGSCGALPRTPGPLSEMEIRAGSSPRPGQAEPYPGTPGGQGLHFERSRRMRSASPTPDPATTNPGSAPTRMTGRTGQ